ncbi:hypothetical protein J6590_034613 [Homalodisca vitripennis]|nr:hypothetical protein J6590_034613 [Homalodisca vitripennis]
MAHLPSRMLYAAAPLRPPLARRRGIAMGSVVYIVHTHLISRFMSSFVVLSRDRGPVDVFGNRRSRIFVGAGRKRTNSTSYLEP